MSAVISQQRYNWMGYTGAQTAVIDTSLLRSGEGGTDNSDYDRRQVVIQDVKDRLYLIKRDLDLIPEEEFKAEEEARQQRREARREREAEEARQREEDERRRQEQAERQRQEQEVRDREAAARQAEEDAAQSKKEEEQARLAARWAALHDSDEDSDVEDEWNAILGKVEWTQDEIDTANENFAKGCRQVIQIRGAGYVSYLDGSEHPTIPALEDHNELYRNRTERSIRDTGVDMPAAEDFSVSELAEANEARDVARKKLDALRCMQDPTYAARLRSDEKDEDANPLMAVTEEDGDEPTLKSALEDAKERATDKRKAYNERAQECAKVLSQAACNRVPEGGNGEEAAEEARVFAEERAAFEQAKKSTTRAAPMAAEMKSVTDSDMYPTEEPAAAKSNGQTPTSNTSSASSKKASPQDSDMYPTEEPVAQNRAISDVKSATSPASSKKASPKSATSPVSSKKASPQDSDMYPTEEPVAQNRAVSDVKSATSPATSKKASPKSATSPVSSKKASPQDSDMYPTEEPAEEPVAQNRAISDVKSATSPASSKKASPKSATSPVSSKKASPQDSDMYPTEEPAEEPVAQNRAISDVKSATSPVSSKKASPKSATSPATSKKASPKSATSPVSSKKASPQDSDMYPTEEPAEEPVARVADLSDAKSVTSTESSESEL